jgi:NDP-sugar pyrophosphorylase family protein
MKIVIPMAGIGARFVAKGYCDPKPLIKMACDGRRIIEHVLDVFQDPDDEFIFICNTTHLETTQMAEILTGLRPNSTIVPIPPHKKGPVFTILPSFQYLQDLDEVMVVYCDGTFKWPKNDRRTFKDYLSAQAPDGCIFTHTGFHPHTLSPTKMAFLKEKNGIVEEIKEKSSYTDCPWNEHASSGIYYFKTAEILKKFSNLLIERDLNYSGEFYVTLTYNLLIEAGLKVGYFETPFVAILGTPEDTQNFEAWHAIIKNTRITKPEDLINCFEYWKSYWETK